MSNTRVRLHSPRLIGALAAIAVLTACAPSGIATLQQDIALAAQEQLKRTLANHYTRELGKGVNMAMADLAQVGGYLDNPLVRILLPPPLGIALGVARDLQANPRAAVLETLMNRAAEQVVPGAAPILQAALAEITPTQARALLDGGGTAGSDYLKTKTSEKLRATLTPLMTQQLGGNGAQEIYSSLLATPAKTDGAAPTTTPATPATSPDLSAYVTEKTIDGMFKNLGVREASLRDNLDAATGGLIQSTNKPAATEPAPLTPAAPVPSAPVESAPVVSAPVVPAPVAPAPVAPAPVAPAPVAPAPLESAPVEPAPVESAPEPELESEPVDSIWM